MNRVLHMYWGRNRPLSFMRYLTAWSFAQLNPDWVIQVYYPPDDGISLRMAWLEKSVSKEHQGAMAADKSVKDYLPALDEIVNVDLVEERFEWVRIPAGFSEVHKSDLLRWKLLAEHGGMWSDFDILYVRPIPQEVYEHSLILCHTLDKYYGPVSRIGFLGGNGPGQEFFHSVYKGALKALEDVHSPNQYQSLGRTVVDFAVAHGVDHTVDKVWNIPLDMVYPIDSTNQLSLLFRKPSMRPLPPDQFALHWFGGWRNVVEAEASINGPGDLFSRSSQLLFYYMARVWKELGG